MDWEIRLHLSVAEAGEIAAQMAHAPQCKAVRPSTVRQLSHLLPEGAAQNMSHLFQLLLWLIASSATAVSARDTAAPEDAAFLPGTIPLDTDGNQVMCPPGDIANGGVQVLHPRHNLRPADCQVHAHGGGILRIKDTWYWYGTSQKRPPGWLSEGVNLYASEDLSSWKYQGQIYRSADSRGMPCSVPYRLERPKVLHPANDDALI